MKKLFLKSSNIERDSYTWNMIACLALAMQSAIILIVMTRTNSLADAGTFSIAYAISSLMLYIGQWGVRRYQASDINEEHSWADYMGFRVVSCVIMVVASLGYVGIEVAAGRYTQTKGLIVLLVCLVQLVDAYSDAFYGRYQQKNRLDVSAKTAAFRVIIGIVGCMLALVLTHNLLISVTVWFVLVLVTFFMSSWIVADEFGDCRPRFEFSHLKKICLDCLPLFLGNFLLLYTGNAPKYAIDACLSEEIQAKFNFIFMPVFVIGLMANFVFNPVLVTMAERWDSKEYRLFNRMVFRQLGVITVITIVCIIGAYLIGCPVLSILYNTDLRPERLELCVLLVGGGALALVNFFAVVFTVIRKQSLLSIGYIIVALLAKLSSEFFVKRNGITGASFMYTTLMIVLALIFAVMLVMSIRKITHNQKGE